MCVCVCVCVSGSYACPLRSPSFLLRTSESKVIPCLNTLAADSDVDVQYFAKEALQEIKQHS